ncbi:unnamed protein product [Mytilus edulis]|uniref:Uncharacterized protein n=1 Tax=Mytilus edulis TaxID=6550 RepID=A0A8S3RIL8_MYTED|nr:unnamed protein product [Mytilus edulis]
MIKSYKKKNWNTFIDIRNDAVAVTNAMLKKIDTRLAEYKVQDVRFDTSFASEILLLISKEIDTHNKHLENIYKFNLLPPYRAMVVTHVKPFITDFFVHLNDRYYMKHSPKSQMKKYKETVWTLFKNVVDSKTETVIASTFFRKAICKAVSEYLDELLPILVQEHIMKSFAHEKYSLMKIIMTDLAEKEYFFDFSFFIRDPSEYARIWMNRYIIKEIFYQGSENYASHICRNSEKKNVSFWIQSFIQKSRELNTIPFSNDDFVHVQNRQVEDLENYIETIIVEMDDIENDIVQPYLDIDQCNVQWKENPISGIMGKAVGLYGKMYVLRRTLQTHRVLQFWVQTNQHYKWGQDEKKESRYYREYKKHFPDWDIIPSHDTSKYWMWVMCKFPNELKKNYSVEEPKLPATWKLITKQEAIDSLSFV